MVKTIRAATTGQGLNIAVVRSRFNELITARLLEGALQALRQNGVGEDDLQVVEVPGAVELALAAEKLMGPRDTQSRVDAVVCLGAVILGETRHFDYVCKIAAETISRVSLRRGVPVSFGVLTCETMEQALARSGEGSANRGFDAAMVALEMANLLAGLGPGDS